MPIPRKPWPDAHFHGPTLRPMNTTAPRTDITIYHNNRCSNPRGALALLRDNGVEPTIVDYNAQPLDAAQLHALLRRLGAPVPELLGRQEAVLAALGLGDACVRDAQLTAPAAEK